MNHINTHLINARNSVREALAAAKRATTKARAAMRAAEEATTAAAIAARKAADARAEYRAARAAYRTQDATATSTVVGSRIVVKARGKGPRARYRLTWSLDPSIPAAKVDLRRTEHKAAAAKGLVGASTVIGAEARETAEAHLRLAIAYAMRKG